MHLWQLLLRTRNLKKHIFRAGVTRSWWFADKNSIKYTKDFFIDEHYPTYLTHDTKDVENYVIIIYWVKYPFKLFLFLHTINTHLDAN